ncbi:DUF4253 domain-containing protein [Kitasatospora sp. NPDC057198]|uniref:DUF4253 domain-containing protein n=1 Tax=Kitasatospora sp. NPDC057198 TaxID=3346046 RepID=UPI003643A6D4
MPDGTLQHQIQWPQFAVHLTAPAPMAHPQHPLLAHRRGGPAPRRADQAELLALEHVLSTAHNIVDDPPTPFPEYADRLVGRTHWWFWWD